MSVPNAAPIHLVDVELFHKVCENFDQSLEHSLLNICTEFNGSS